MAANTEITRLDSVEREKIEAILSAQPLPNTTSTDNGKFLKVVSGKWAKGTLPSDLPEVDAEDNGKVLMVVEGEWAVASLPAETVSEPAGE